MDSPSPKAMRLRKPAEFRRVYDLGRRYNGSALTAFICPNELSHHRFGVTASRRGVGNAVARNRVKRLLRETFRLSLPQLNNLARKYDWVFNARRILVDLKVTAPLSDLQSIISRVARDEAASPVVLDRKTQ